LVRQELEPALLVQAVLRLLEPRVPARHAASRDRMAAQRPARTGIIFADSAPARQAGEGRPVRVRLTRAVATAAARSCQLSLGHYLRSIRQDPVKSRVAIPAANPPDNPQKPRLPSVETFHE
jgi:hypothetical protein